MAFSSTWILSLKALLISTSVLSIAMVTKFSVPLISNFAVNEVPAIWSTLLSWLRPPYLYVVINGIIITIVASSRFHHKPEDDGQSEPLVPANTPQPSELPSELPQKLNQPAFGGLESPVPYESEPTVLDVKPVVIKDSEVVVHDEDEFMISRSVWTPRRMINSLENQTEYLFPATEKPLVSSRFGHRKPVKASPEGGRALRVAKPKRQETLESTWKTITDGRHMPLTRHLRKSDTWENHGHHVHVSPQDSSSPTHRVNKLETFKDRTNYNPPQVSSVSSSPGSGKLRKEASLSQDELNRRVEAFIKKFNDEMRLQRQESLNRYVEMINRGAH